VEPETEEGENEDSEEEEEEEPEGGGRSGSMEALGWERERRRRERRVSSSDWRSPGCGAVATEGRTGSWASERVGGSGKEERGRGYSIVSFWGFIFLSSLVSPNPASGEHEGGGSGGGGRESSR